VIFSLRQFQFSSLLALLKSRPLHNVGARFAAFKRKRIFVLNTARLEKIPENRSEKIQDDDEFASIKLAATTSMRAIFQWQIERSRGILAAYIMCP